MLWKGTASMMVATAHSDKSRDYTVPEGGVLVGPQAPTAPNAAGWPGNVQATQMYSQGPSDRGQMPGWDPSMQGDRMSTPSGPNPYTQQAYRPPSGQMYPPWGSGFPPASGELPIDSMPYGAHQRAQPPGAPSTGWPPV